MTPRRLERHRNLDLNGLWLAYSPDQAESLQNCKTALKFPPEPPIPLLLK
jgi:hypothetical protein